MHTHSFSLRDSSWNERECDETEYGTCTIIVLSAYFDGHIVENVVRQEVYFARVLLCVIATVRGQHNCIKCCDCVCTCDVNIRPVRQTLAL